MSKKQSSADALSSSARRMVLEEARRRGFDDCAFCSPFLGDVELEPLRSMIRDERFGNMNYLKRHLPLRENPELLLPGVKTAVVVVKNYRNTDMVENRGRARISRFAAGMDYHDVIGSRLSVLADFIAGILPGTQSYWGVDSRPLSERAYALKAGLGFIGRNGLVIHPVFGSYIFIAVVLTTASFDFDIPLAVSCADCGRCTEACPTGALSRSGFDAAKCTSYRTQRIKMTEAELAEAGGWIFGCDICQEVCPHNGTGPYTDWPEFMPESGCGFNLSDGAQIPDKSPLAGCRRFVEHNAAVYFSVDGNRHGKV